MKKLVTAGLIGLMGLIGLIGLPAGRQVLFPASLAQTPSPGPDSEAEAVEGIREAVREEVQKRLEQASVGQKKAVVGTLTDIINTTLVLDTRQGEVSVRVATDAAILRNRQEIGFEDLELDEYAIAMGYLDEEGQLLGRRIVVSDQPEPRDRLSVFGQVTATENGDLTLRHPQTGQSWTVISSGNTTITKMAAGEKEEIDFDQIAEGDKVVVVGRADEDVPNTLRAILLHVVSSQEPETEAVEPEKTPEATPQAEGE